MALKNGTSSKVPPWEFLWGKQGRTSWSPHRQRGRNCAIPKYIQHVFSQLTKWNKIMHGIHILAQQQWSLVIMASLNISKHLGNTFEVDMSIAFYNLPYFCRTTFTNTMALSTTQCPKIQSKFGKDLTMSLVFQCFLPCFVHNAKYARHARSQCSTWGGVVRSEPK